MSYIEVYGIVDATGELDSIGEARNSHGFQPLIWRELAQKYDMLDPLMAGLFRLGAAPPAHADRTRDLWYNFGNLAVLTRPDSLVLGATLDGVWVSRATLPALIEGLDAFWLAIRGEVKFVPTLPTVTGLLREILANPKYRGVCFYPTSTTDNPWALRDGEDDYRRFVFGKDTRTSFGKEPWELGEGLEHNAQAFVAKPLGPPSPSLERRVAQFDARQKAVFARRRELGLPVEDQLERGFERGVVELREIVKALTYVPPGEYREARTTQVERQLTWLSNALLPHDPRPTQDRDTVVP